MNVRVPRNAAGFTIVETLIVLAVTGALFASAAVLINGRQRQTAFNQSIRNIQSELQQTANEVGSGNYYNNGTISCTKSAGRPLLTTSATDKQGTNRDCVFLGKIIQFAVGANDPEQYNVYTLVGIRNATANVQNSLSGSATRLIARSSTDAPTVPDAFEAKKLQYGLTISRQYYKIPANTSKSFLAIGMTSGVVNPGSTDTSQQANVVFIPSSGPAAGFGLEKAQAVNSINSALGLASTTLNPQNGVQLCFNSGGTNQSGLITVGGAGRIGASVTLKIFEKADCQ